MSTTSWLDAAGRRGRRATLAQAAVAIATGLLWALASPPVGAWPLAWVATAPTLVLWARATTARRAGLHGWLTGAAMSAAGFHWFAYLMARYAGLPWPVAILTLLAFAAYQGLPWLVAARAVWWIRAWSAARGRPLPMALVAPAAIVAVEHLWPVIFPYQLAISQVAAPTVIQIADVLGGSAVTALLVASAGAIVDLVDSPAGARRWRPAAAVAGAVAVTLGYGAWRIRDVAATRAAAPHVKVGLVQPNEPMSLGPHDYDVEARRLADIQAESARLEAAGAQLLVWSESSYPPSLPRDLRRDLDPSAPWRIRRGFTVPVVIGATTRERMPRGQHARHYNSAVLVVGEDLVARHDKVHRVLGSEWNPVVEWIPSLRTTLPEGYAGGDGPTILPVDVGGRTVRLGPMICLEDVVPAFGRAVAAEDPDLLVNLTIDTWFGTWAEPWQHQALAALRAVEVRKDLVRAVNTGPSGLVEATGRIGAETPVRASDDAPVEGIVVDAAVMSGDRTIYARIGDLFAWLCALATIAGWYLGRRGGRRPRAARPARG